VVKSRRVRWSEHVARMREMRNENNILVVEPWKEETTWEDSIQMVLKETMYEAVDWIQLAQDRVQ